MPSIFSQSGRPLDPGDDYENCKRCGCLIKVKNLTKRKVCRDHKWCASAALARGWVSSYKARKDHRKDHR